MRDESASNEKTFRGDSCSVGLMRACLLRREWLTNITHHFEVLILLKALDEALAPVEMPRRYGL